MTGLPVLPYLKPWYRVTRDDDRLLLEYAQSVVVLEGAAVARLLPALLPLLDGTRDVATLASEIGGDVEPAVRNAVGVLATHGALTEGPPEPALAAAALAATSVRGRSPAEVREALSSRSVALRGDSPLADAIAHLLRASGVENVTRATLGAPLGEEFSVVMPSPAERPELGDWNAQALAAGVPWLQVLEFDGRFAAVGPLYLPGDTCCWQCFQLRRRANVGYPDEFDAVEATVAPRRSSPALDALTSSVAAWAALRRIVDDDPFLAGSFYALEVGAELSFRRHHVYAVPRCPACSATARSSPPLPWAEAA